MSEPQCVVHCAFVSTVELGPQRIVEQLHSVLLSIWSGFLPSAVLAICSAPCLVEFCTDTGPDNRFAEVLEMVGPAKAKRASRLLTFPCHFGSLTVHQLPDDDDKDKDNHSHGLGIFESWGKRMPYMRSQLSSLVRLDSCFFFN